MWRWKWERESKAGMQTRNGPEGFPKSFYHLRWSAKKMRTEWYNSPSFCAIPRALRSWWARYHILGLWSNKNNTREAAIARKGGLHKSVGFFFKIQASVMNVAETLYLCFFSRLYQRQNGIHNRRSITSALAVRGVCCILLHDVIH